MNLLIADDSAIVRKRILKMLNSLPGRNTLFEAEDGEAALNLLHQNTMDVVILDIRMPKRNGIEVLRECRSEGWTMKIMMLTNYTDDKSRSESMNTGADYFFDKSSQFENMVDTVTTIAEQHISNNPESFRNVS